ncbi:hypothetical protein OCK74_25180 [Chitinophagaceae bacterium LB-8]|uniref:Uncharacterized protein n=1 Tax=Paraflavisolibacter caeni TaxID=2982496 RepID=A0A9X2Y0Y7_9BACT|nr:hypothetical protein [Paraflavisolibacter caeni]MCU7552437.1 hypothetical protein [Paraflavisolibacter caeni]
MKKFYFFGLLSSLFTIQAYSQGCVPVRSTGSSVIERPSSSKKAQSPQWTFSATNRYFKSFRHFVGDVEQKQRLENGTEVINKSYTLDLNAVRYLNRRWAISMNVPLIANTRSSLYEHGNVDRHSTESYGMGDVRLTAYSWLLNPKKFKKGNIQAGLGVKLPTGNYKYDDYFYTGVSGVKVLGPVDQSIQPGDGGVGIITELNNFYSFNKRLSFYSNLLYLVNPRETNGVSTARGRTPSPASIIYGSDVMSVPDQYMARLGANVTFLKKFVFSGGARIDGIPAKDLVGGSNGFRRPGYIISAEPSLTFRTKKMSTFLTVPIAFERNRIQSVPDKVRSELTKSYYKGDAAFADYVVNLGVAFNLFKPVKKPAKTEPQIYRPYYNNSYRDSQCPKNRSNCQGRMMKL